MHNDRTRDDRCGCFVNRTSGGFRQPQDAPAALPKRVLDSTVTYATVGVSIGKNALSRAKTTHWPDARPSQKNMASLLEQVLAKPRKPFQ